MSVTACLTVTETPHCAAAFHSCVVATSIHLHSGPVHCLVGDGRDSSGLFPGLARAVVSS